MKRYLPYIVLSLVALVIGVSCSSEKAAVVESSIEFTALDLDGNLRKSSEWIGQQPVVINIWGTWCPPCRQEIPDLVRLYGEYKDKGLEFVGLALERSNGPDGVKRFAQQHNMDWVMLMGDREIAIDLQATGVPKTILVDRYGKVMQVTDVMGRSGDAFVGPQPYEVFKAAFDRLLEI